MKLRPCGCPVPKIIRSYDKGDSAKYRLTMLIHTLCHLKDKAMIDVVAKDVMQRHNKLLKKLED